MLRIELEAWDGRFRSVDITGFDADALAELIAGDEPNNEGQTDEDAVPRSARHRSRAGDVWIMGQHRLLCGDSTVAEATTGLLPTASRSTWFTDPPYNVNYANSAKDKMRGKDRAILNDNLGDGFYDFLLAALTPTVAHCRGGSMWRCRPANWMCCRPPFVRRWRGRRSSSGPRTPSRWAAPTTSASTNRSFYGWPRGRQRHWCGDRDQGDVWLSRSRRRTICIRR